MQPYLTHQHHALQEAVGAFAREAIVPVARELDDRAEFPWKNVKAMGEMGLFGVSLAEEYGGLGRDYLSYILVIEELAKYDASHAITVSAHSTLGASPILAFGTPEQKERYLPLLARGQVLGGFGLTESGAGSDAAGTKTRAVREDGGYRLTGSKIFITHAGVGEVFVVTAVTDPGRGPHGITSFIVTKPTVDLKITEELGIGHAPELDFIEGVRAGRKEDKMGWRSSDTRELLLDDALVPEENRLGGEGEGFVNFVRTLDAGRIGLAALSLGLAQGAVDAAVRYTSEDRDSQTVRFGIAELATEIEAGRHLTYHAALLKDHGRPFTKEAAMAKLFCSELAMRATIRAVQLLGAAGYTDEYPVERMFRDAKVCEIGEGTSEIQKLVISRELLREYGEEGLSATASSMDMEQ